MTIRLGQWGYYALEAVELNSLPFVRHNLGQVKQGLHNGLKNKCCLRKTAGGLLLRKHRKSHSHRKGFALFFFSQLLFYLTGVGQYLSCFIKCVGAKCTKRCYRV